MNYQTFNKYIKNNLHNYNKKTVIGHTFKGRKIYAYHFGKFLSSQILISSGMHAREYITSLLTTKICATSKYNQLDFGIWLVPVCNPDGIKICLDKKHSKKLIKLNNNKKTFSLWKANSLGVDINVNFDSNWSKGKKNILKPNSENYIGKTPNSENETRAIIEFVKKIKPIMALSFHSKGNVIFYGYKLPSMKKNFDKKFAKFLAKEIKYKPKKTKNSYGGLSDYLSEKLGIISNTLEIGNEKINHPITIDYLDDLLKNYENFFKKLNSSKSLQQLLQVVSCQKGVYQHQE